MDVWKTSAVSGALDKLGDDATARKKPYCAC